MRNATFWDKFWKDKHGETVIWQRPNIFLIVWFVALIINIISPYGALGKITSGVSIVAILIWSVLEAWKGVNYFRRLLGIAVLLLTVGLLTL